MAVVSEFEFYSRHTGNFAAKPRPYAITGVTCVFHDEAKNRSGLGDAWNNRNGDTMIPTCPYCNGPLNAVLNEKARPIGANIHSCGPCKLRFALCCMDGDWIWTDQSNLRHHKIENQDWAANLGGQDSGAAVLLVEWLEPRGKPDGIGEIKEKLDDFYLENPTLEKVIIHVCRIKDPDPECFLIKLNKAILAAGEALQLLYIDCHGSPLGLSQDTNQCPDMVATYSQLRSTFRRAMAKSQPEEVSLVLGVCEAMNDVTNITSNLPRRIISVAGYTDKPLTQHTRELMATVIKEAVMEFAAVQAALDEAFADNLGPGTGAVKTFHMLLLDRIKPLYAPISDPRAQPKLSEKANEGIGDACIAVRTSKSWKYYPFTKSDPRATASNSLVLELS